MFRARLQTFGKWWPHDHIEGWYGTSEKVKKPSSRDASRPARDCWSSYSRIGKISNLDFAYSPLNRWPGQDSSFVQRTNRPTTPNVHIAQRHWKAGNQMMIQCTSTRDVFPIAHSLRSDQHALHQHHHQLQELHPNNQIPNKPQTRKRNGRNVPNPRLQSRKSRCELFFLSTASFCLRSMISLLIFSG